MWHLSADTGGTFTDCYAITPTGAEMRCKVLSASCLRSRIVQVVNDRQVRLADDWSSTDGLLTGFDVADVSGNPGGKALAWISSERLLTLPSVPTDWRPGTLLELRTGEEAPVLAARLMTQTPPGQTFPTLDFRVATTRATNALLERKGSRVALFITQGFGDLLAIGDQRRADLFALRHQPRPQFHEVVCEVRERLDAEGKVILPLDETYVREAAAAFLQQGITHAAVALMHSHVNADHELSVGQVLKRAGFIHISLSSELAPFVKLLPRAQSAVANAYLTGPVQSFLEGVAGPLHQSDNILDPGSNLQVMTSAGGLEPATTIRPKDMLLSGPAGGAIGAANAAKRVGYEKIITLDMGGTSTDVARIEGQPSYRFTQNIEGMSLMTPCVAIETVAAGGGSICAWNASGLSVGPHSAGSSPGPACYGKGGPLTITDVNLLLGRFDPEKAPIPLDVAASEARLNELLERVNTEATRVHSRESLLAALHDLAVEHMADAIRRISVSEGYDPQGYALLAFGGAGPQHACAVAAKLGMDTILVPRNAGILSAVGLHEAVPESVLEKQVLRPLTDVIAELDAWVTEMAAQSPYGQGNVTRLAELRLRGQDTPLQVTFSEAAELPALYQDAYRRLFGYAPPANRTVELVSLRVIVKAVESGNIEEHALDKGSQHPATKEMRLLQDAFSTLVVEPGWAVRNVEGFGYILAAGTAPQSASAGASADLMRHRFHSLVDDMGALLKRTSISTNIRERLDFSCALLDARGVLIASAPHIPVHLGALGVCVRETLKHFTPKAGDAYLTNHPAYGGSHLPDVTLISPVFDATESLLGFVANRAHHAEIGGITPGSMPAHATYLVEEGVVIAPRYLVREGTTLFDEVAEMLTGAAYPTRNLADNLADLHAQLAANRLGAERLQSLARADDTSAAMAAILEHSARAMSTRLKQVPESAATQELDDGSAIHVRVTHRSQGLCLDFTGTAATHPRNLNATTAIVQSAVLYVLRLMLQEDLPLNEGLMQPIELVLPSGTLLNPAFTGDATRDPAVVGGNVEVSQRLVDTLIKALNLQACSQGTMNNLLFGNERFGYYETISGGAGAGRGYDGASGLHTHMTNTAITDPEILEQRYPVRLHQFALRRGSGGDGKWRGGDGVVREFEFLEPLTVSLLTQHRNTGPFGLDGGADGKPGRQTLVHADGSAEVLPSSASVPVQAGDRLIMETPGGGGVAV